MGIPGSKNGGPLVPSKAMEIGHKSPYIVLKNTPYKWYLQFGLLTWPVRIRTYSMFTVIYTYYNKD